MNETTWLRLSAKRIVPDSHPSDATWVTESASPYEVPTEVKSSYDGASGCLLVEFRYVEREQESVEERKLNQYFVVRIGKTSKRIWSFSFDVHRFHRDQMKELMEAVESKDTDASNGQIAARAFCTKSAELFSVAP